MIQPTQDQAPLAGDLKLWLARLALPLFSVLVVLLSSEGALRLTRFGRTLTPRLGEFMEYHPIRGWRNKPNADGFFMTREFTVHLTYNSRGIRGPERPYSKPPRTYRIIVLGDSYIDGYSVDAQDRVTEVLETELNNAGVPMHYEVIAMGTSGYSTDQELLWLQSDGWKYDPDLVLVMFYYNDVWANAQAATPSGSKPLFAVTDGALVLAQLPRPRETKPTGVPSPPRRRSPSAWKDWLERESKLYELARYGVRNMPSVYTLAIKAGLAWPLPEGTMYVGQSIPEFGIFRRVSTPEIEYAWSITSALLRQMKQEAAGHRARLLAFYIPLMASTDTGQWSATLSKYHRSPEEWDVRQPARSFLAVCAAEGISCIEPTDRFSRVTQAQRQSDALYWKYDRHWNAAGHRVAAQILAEYVRSEIGEGTW